MGLYSPNDGTFYLLDLGKYPMYGRAAYRAVLLQTTRGKIVVTPESRDAFVAELLEETSR